jgi:hypothetical protein
VGAVVIDGLLACLTVLGVGLVAVGGGCMGLAWLDARAGRGWVLDEGAAGESPLQVAPSSSATDRGQASSLCEGCGRLHPPEALPLELLLAQGVPVSVSRWFGRGGR